MKELSINLLKLLFIWTIAVFLVASCGRSAYASSVHQKADELALVGYNNEGVQSAYRTFFVRNISMHLHVMAGLERDTFGCAGFLRYQSTNPFWSCHPHLVVNGKTPTNEGAH
ncbi:hypothetical protein ACVBEE_06440 [Acinetobacter sp. ANC 3781]